MCDSNEQATNLFTCSLQFVVISDTRFVEIILLCNQLLLLFRVRHTLGGALVRVHLAKHSIKLIRTVSG